MNPLAPPAPREVHVAAPATAEPSFAHSDAYQNVLVAACQHLLDAIEDDRIDIEAWAPETVARYVRSQARLFMQAWAIALDEPQLEILAEALVKELIGFGPLDDLLHDPTVDDILVNGYQDIQVSQGGRRVRVRERFSDELHLLRILRRMVAPLGCRLDESNPMVDIRLPGGGRLNAIIPPVAVDGPVVSIRRFRRHAFTLGELQRMGSLDGAVQALLHAMVLGRCNVLVTGAACSGRTSLLNALVACVPVSERVVTLEDTVELSLEHPCVVRLASRSGDADGQGAVNMRDLLHNSLRMAPDRIVVGELRGAEVRELLQATYDGQDGTMATLRARSPADALCRIERLAALARSTGSDDTLRRQIAGALDFIVHIARLDNGRRVLASITEIIGVDDATISTQEIVRHDVQYDIDGSERDGWIWSEAQPRSHKLEPFRSRLHRATQDEG